MSTVMRMTREQVEAHLTLCGWQPLSWGQGGAAKNDVVIYTTKTKVYEIPQGPGVRFNVHTIWNQDPATIAKHALDAWLWNDAMFWRVANECLEFEACTHADTDPETTAAWMASTGSMRCPTCHQLI